MSDKVNATQEKSEPEKSPLTIAISKNTKSQSFIFWNFKMWMSSTYISYRFSEVYPQIA